MNWVPVLAVMMAAFLGSLAQLFFKKVSGKPIKSVFKDFKFYIAVILYGLSAVIFIVSLKFEKLVILYPIIATSYVWTSLLAIKYLKEEMNNYKWAGVLLIIIGVFFIIK